MIRRPMPAHASSPARMAAGERRAQLLDVTKAIVAERGFHAVSIEAVAREAGISRPVVYGHFADLGGLLEALVDRESARALAQLAPVLPEDVSAEDPRRLLAALGTYLAAVQADPARWRLVLMPPEGAPDSLRERIAAGRAAAVAQLAEAIRLGAGPWAASPDPELTARTLSAVADEAARLVLEDPEGYPAERLLAHAGWVLDRLGS